MRERVGRERVRGRDGWGGRVMGGGGGENRGEKEEQTHKHTPIPPKSQMEK